MTAIRNSEWVDAWVKRLINNDAIKIRKNKIPNLR